MYKWIVLGGEHTNCTRIVTLDEINYQAQSVTTSTGELGTLETFISENQDKNQAQFWPLAYTEHAH